MLSARGAEKLVSNKSLCVLCTNCGLVSRRPGNFLHVRRSFVCGRCKEMIPLNSRTILDGPSTAQGGSRQRYGSERGRTAPQSAARD